MLCDKEGPRDESRPAENIESPLQVLPVAELQIKAELLAGELQATVQEALLPSLAPSPIRRLDS
jgi:hypothetical protein